jgi:potassium-transporting ATPase KdpC subunit
MLAVLAPALRASLLLWVLLGLAYPLAVTGLERVLFPYQGQGSLIRSAEGTVIGSRLIGQEWHGPEWFRGRLSATTGADPNDPDKAIAFPYNAANSGGSNLCPTSRVLAGRLAADRKTLDQQQPELAGKRIPGDMLTTSGSSLDSDISPDNAELQVPRVAAARGVAEEQIAALLARHIAGRSLGIFGEPRVNVLELNFDVQRTYPVAGLTH